MSGALETGTPQLTAERDGHVAILTINRPESANALSQEMHEGFDAVLSKISADDGIRCVVVTGTGRNFCAGGDIKRLAEAAEPPAPDVDALRRRQRMTTLRLARLPQVTVAAVNGPAIGAGMSVALACDLRVGSRRARFAAAFSRVGSSGDFGGSYFLPRLIGLGRAKELYLFGDPVDAESAERLGLLNAVFDEEDFDGGWRSYASRLANGAPLAQRAILGNLGSSLETSLEEMLDREAASTVACMTSDDHKEALAALREGRPPTFEGR